MGQRKYPRVSLHSEASIRCGDINFCGMLANLSLNGIYIRTDTRIPLGDSAEVNFPDKVSTRNPTLKVNGKVVRIDKDGIALKFRQMDIDSFINLHLIVAEKALTFNT